MTAVALTVTDAPASGVRAEPEASDPGLALQISLGRSGAVERTRLVDLAQAILSLVGERAPDLAVHSALLLGADGPEGEDVRVPVPGWVPGSAAPRPASGAPSSRVTPASAAERARAAWRTSARPGPLMLVDAAAREVTVAGDPVRLTFMEFELLEHLLRSAHRAVSRSELLKTVWRDAHPSEGTRTIDVHVRRLRDKLGGCLEIATVRGVGYRCEPTPEIVLVGSGDAG